MSTLNVDKVDPNTGTTLELGTSGDTVTVPTGAGLTVPDEVKTNKISPATGTAFALGDSGDTFTVPSGATLDISASTLTPPATMPASSGVNLTALNATQLTSGKVPTAQLGTGTASSSTVLYGDQTYKAEPGGGKILQVQSATFTSTTANGSNGFAATFLTDQITPSATSSKIMVTVSFTAKSYLGTTSGSQTVSGNWTMYRSINGATYANIYPTQTADNPWQLEIFDESVWVAWQNMTFVDSPSTTDTVDYKVYSKLTSATSNFAIGYASAEYKDSTIVLMEIDGS